MRVRFASSDSSICTAARVAAVEESQRRGKQAKSWAFLQKNFPIMSFFWCLRCGWANNIAVLNVGRLCREGGEELYIKSWPKIDG